MDGTPLTAWALARAREIGFAAAGVAAVEPIDAAPLRAWLDAGFGAEMDYLVRHLPLRADLTRVLPGAKAAICVALPYPGPATDESQVGYVARYARGADYHDVIREMLERLWRELHALAPAAQGRCFVDGGPLPERELARRAGIGWPGAHSCLIADGMGTRFLLGEILTTLPLTPSAPAQGSCGSCYRCIAACPTGAIVRPGIVDARRCLSYLLIEQTGAIPRSFRPLVGTRLFGCDTCQDACPHNRGVGELPTRLHPAADLLAPDLLTLLRMSPAAFNERFRGTTLARLKMRGLQRNACVALGNLGDAAAIPALRWALRETEPLVRGHAAWALGQLGDCAALGAARAVETDSRVIEEIDAALSA